MRYTSYASVRKGEPMSTFSLRVIACDRIFYDGRCEQVILPISDGSMGVKAHHENLAVAIEVGELKIQKEDGTWENGVVGTGFAQIINNRVTVIVDTAEHPEEIDVRRAKEAKERAEEQIRQHNSMIEYRMGQASLARAMSRLRVTHNNNRPIGY